LLVAAIDRCEPWLHTHDLAARDVAATATMAHAPVPALLRTDRVIAHIDMVRSAAPVAPRQHPHPTTPLPPLRQDGFYAQVLASRAGVARTVPVGVQQWGSLIAVNYPAKATGVRRGMDVRAALAACPTLTLLHVDVVDAAGEPVAVPPGVDAPVRPVPSMKVSLRPFRLQSLRIMRAIARVVGPAHFEKASVDEVRLGGGGG
jgi:hypothetical protein